jgi:LysM repeat protein
MSRKDTIIVAVLINAGLLIVLFASALKSGGFSQEMASSSQMENSSAVEVAFQKEGKSMQGDEVDQVLHQLAQPAPLLSQESTSTGQITTQLTQPIAAAAPTPSSFASDLQAIASPQPALVEQPVVAMNPPAENAVVEVRVKKGDVLEKIARHHHCTVDDVMKCNKLTSTNLKIGQVLKLPSKTGKTAASPISHDVASAAKYYTIKNGDNPWTIAVKHRMKVEELLKLNNLNEEKARRLKPGDQIRVQ